jgi:TonB family protein
VILRADRLGLDQAVALDDPHAVSTTFERFEYMSRPAVMLALVLHVLVAAFLLWTPTDHHDEFDDAIEVTMEAPKPQPPPTPKPPPQQAPALDPLGLPPAGPVGPTSTAPPMERGLPTHEPPAEKAEQPTPKDEPAQKPEPPQQAMAEPAESMPPPPSPTLEKELPPVEAPPPPLTSRDIPRYSPTVPERKPEPPPSQPQQRAQPPRPALPLSPQLQPSPLTKLSRNAPSQRSTEQPRSTWVNPADIYAQNTILDAYLQRVVYQVSLYRFDGTGLSPSDSVIASFTIARSGSLLAVRIIRSSGKPSLDRDAIAAFQQTAPFPPLPVEVPGDSRTFSLTFFPGRQPS